MNIRKPLELVQPSEQDRQSARRHLLIRMLVGTIALVVSTSAYYSYQAVRNLVLENLKENAFLQVKQGADEIDTWLANLSDRAETMANTPIMQTMDWSKIEPYLQQEVVRQRDFFKLNLTYLNGTRHNTAGATPESGYVGDRDWFQQAIAGKTFVGNPIISRSTGIPLIIISAPIWSVPFIDAAPLPPEEQKFRDRALAELNLNPDANRETKPIGLLGASVSTKRITAVINQLQYGDNSYAFALNSKGRAIAHPNPELMSTKDKPAASFLETSNGNLAKIAEKMVAGSSSIELVSVDGTEKYIAYLALSETNWSVALTIPRANIESKLQLLDIIALVIVGLTLTLIAVLWQVQSFEQTQLKKSEISLEQHNRKLQNALTKLKQTQAQLIHTEKMSSLGQMVAGVAHEINNPTSFISGNLQHARNYVGDLLELIEIYDKSGQISSPEIEEKIEEMDLEFLREDIERLFASMQTGCDRIESIVRGLRVFSRLDEAEMKPVDIHASIDSTIMLLQHLMRSDGSRSPIEIVKEYGDLPKVTCYASQLNQVFYHILSNAIDALSPKREVSEAVAPSIHIRTETADSNTAKITIADSGVGMMESVREKIFDPFFTTKPVGKGTGLGLAIAHQIIVGEHGGNLTCSSTRGEGTEFAIAIPLTPKTQRNSHIQSARDLSSNSVEAAAIAQP